MDQVSGPLAGLLVADFSRVLAGPYCTMILGDLGAEVIKVEGPGGDDTRHWMPPVRDGISTYYLSINRNKRSIQLNLRDAEDRAAAASAVAAQRRRRRRQPRAVLGLARALGLA